MRESASYDAIAVSAEGDEMLERKCDSSLNIAEVNEKKTIFVW